MTVPMHPNEVINRIVGLNPSVESIKANYTEDNDSIQSLQPEGKTTTFQFFLRWMIYLISGTCIKKNPELDKTVESVVAAASQVFQDNHDDFTTLKTLSKALGKLARINEANLGSRLRDIKAVRKNVQERLDALLPKSSNPKLEGKSLIELLLLSETLQEEDKAECHEEIRKLSENCLLPIKFLKKKNLLGAYNLAQPLASGIESAEGSKNLMHVLKCLSDPASFLDTKGQPFPVEVRSEIIRNVANQVSLVLRNSEKNEQLKILEALSPILELFGEFAEPLVNDNFPEMFNLLVDHLDTQTDNSLLELIVKKAKQDYDHREESHYLPHLLEEAGKHSGNFLKLLVKHGGGLEFYFREFGHNENIRRQLLAIFGEKCKQVQTKGMDDGYLEVVNLGFERINIDTDKPPCAAGIFKMLRPEDIDQIYDSLPVYAQLAYQASHGEFDINTIPRFDDDTTRQDFQNAFIKQFYLFNPDEEHKQTLIQGLFQNSAANLYLLIKLLSDSPSPSPMKFYSPEAMKEISKKDKFVLLKYIKDMDETQKKEALNIVAMCVMEDRFRYENKAIIEDLLKEHIGDFLKDVDEPIFLTWLIPMLVQYEHLNTNKNKNSWTGFEEAFQGLVESGKTWAFLLGLDAIADSIQQGSNEAKQEALAKIKDQFPEELQASIEKYLICRKIRDQLLKTTTESELPNLEDLLKISTEPAQMIAELEKLQGLDQGQEEKRKVCLTKIVTLFTEEAIPLFLPCLNCPKEYAEDYFKVNPQKSLIELLKVVEEVYHPYAKPAEGIRALSSRPEKGKTLRGLIQEFQTGKHFTKTEYVKLFSSVMKKLGYPNGGMDPYGNPEPQFFDELFGRMLKYLNLKDVVYRTMYPGMEDSEEQIQEAIAQNRLVGLVEGASEENPGHFSAWIREQGEYYRPPEFTELEDGEIIPLADAQRTDYAGVQANLYAQATVFVFSNSFNNSGGEQGGLPNINSCPFECCIRILAKLLPLPEAEIGK